MEDRNVFLYERGKKTNYGTELVTDFVFVFFGSA